MSFALSHHRQAPSPSLSSSLSGLAPAVSPRASPSSSSAPQSPPTSRPVLFIPSGDIAFDLGMIQVNPILSRMAAEDGVELDPRPHGGYQHCFKGSSLLAWCMANLLGWSTKAINDLCVMLLKKGVILDSAGETEMFKAYHYFHFKPLPTLSVDPMSPRSKDSGKARVVIVGGGFGGGFLAVQLDKLKDFQVTLIDNKEFMENTPVLLRLMTEPRINESLELFKKRSIPHHKYLSNAVVVKGIVREVTPDKRVITDAGTFGFDYLVISTGSSYEPRSIKMSPNVNWDLFVSSYRLKALADSALKIESASSIIIVGGGPVGTELAAEIATKYPLKKLMLVHCHSRLVERFDASVSKKAQKFFDGKNIKFYFEERVVAAATPTAADGSQYATLTLESGAEVQGDMVCWCTGQAPNTSFMTRYLATSLNDAKYIIVNDFFQVEGNPSMFAIGDVAALGEEKRAERACTHSKFVLEHIKRDRKGKALTNAYKALKKPTTYMLSLGPKNAIVVVSNKAAVEGTLAAKGKEAFFQRMMDNLSSARASSSQAQVHDIEHVPFPRINPKQVQHQIVVFGAERRYNIMARLYRSLHAAGIPKVVAALPKDEKIKAFKGDMYTGEERKITSQEYAVRHYDQARPSTLGPILKEADVSVLLVDPPFVQDLKRVEAFAEGLAGEKSGTFVLITPHYSLTLPDAFADVRARLRELVDTANKTFKRVIMLVYSGAFEWLLRYNGDFSSTNVFVFPYPDRSLPWLSFSDLIECAANVAAAPTAFTKDTYFLTGGSYLTAQGAHAVLQELIGSEFDMHLPDKEEAIAILDDSPVNKVSRLIIEGVYNGNPQVSSDASSILQRPPHTFREWAAENAQTFV